MAKSRSRTRLPSRREVLDQAREFRLERQAQKDRALLDWRLDPYSVQIYPDTDTPGQKWLSQSCKCPACGHTWAAVAPLGSFGIECPRCHECDPAYHWKER